MATETDITKREEEHTLEAIGALIKLDRPYEDLITRLIDNLSPSEFRTLACYIGPKVTSKDYKRSREEWMKKFKESQGEPDPDRWMILADRHRVHFCMTHPYQICFRVDHPFVLANSDKVREVYDFFMFKVLTTLGRERSLALGYDSEQVERVFVSQVAHAA